MVRCSLVLISGLIFLEASAIAAGQVDPSRSQVTVNPSTVPPGTPAQITVTLLDATGSPVPGIAVSLTSSNGPGETIAPVPGSQLDPTGHPVTGADGAVTFSTSPTISGIYTALDINDGIALPQGVTVNVVGTGTSQDDACFDNLTTNEEICYSGTGDLMRVAAVTLTTCMKKCSKLTITTSEVYNPFGKNKRFVTPAAETDYACVDKCMKESGI